MGASDFNTEQYANYTYEDVQGSFDISKDFAQKIIPSIQSALAVNPDIHIIGVPWSYPAWMKDNNALNGGSPRDDLNYAHVGAYFKNYVSQYTDLGLCGLSLCKTNHCTLPAPTRQCSCRLTHMQLLR